MNRCYHLTFRTSFTVLLHILINFWPIKSLTDSFVYVLCWPKCPDLGMVWPRCKIIWCGSLGTTSLGFSVSARYKILFFKMYRSPQNFGTPTGLPSNSHSFWNRGCKVTSTFCNSLKLSGTCQRELISSNSGSGVLGKLSCALSSLYAFLVISVFYFFIFPHSTKQISISIRKGL